MACRDYETQDFQDIIIGAALLVDTLREGFAPAQSGIAEARAGALPPGA